MREPLRRAREDRGDRLSAADAYELIEDSSHADELEWFLANYPDDPRAGLVRSKLDRITNPWRRVWKVLVQIGTVIAAIAGLVATVFTILGSWDEVAAVWNGATRQAETNEEQFTATTVAPVVAAPSQPVLDTTKATPDARYVEDFQALLTEAGIVHFSAPKVLYLGQSHGSSSNCTNSLPPRDLWPNILPTLTVLDALQEQIGAPLRLVSIYRDTAYNRCLGGAANSTHTRFQAADFAFADTSTTPADWGTALRAMRDDGAFSGGVGVYNSFVHLDTRGLNVDW